MKNLHNNVWILTIAQALISSLGPLIVFVGGFIGMELAPEKSLATLPIAFMIIGVAVCTIPVVSLMGKIGRKTGSLLAIVTAIANSGLAAYAIQISSFWLFCLSVALYGIVLVAVSQFRFAAIESVKEEQASTAVSVILMGGLAAAFIGPELGLAGKDLLDVPYTGSFALIAICLALAFLVVLGYKPVTSHALEAEGEQRPLKQIARQPIFLVAAIGAAAGFAVMSFIMTATPISMHLMHHFSMEDTKWVIQSHVIAMYLPSLFTGVLIRKFGVANMLYAGIAVYLLCLAIGYVDQQYVHYWSALVLLGVGWNFMFVSATSLLPKSHRESEKFKVQACNDFSIFTAQAIASLSAGFVIQALGWHWLLMLNIPLLLLAGWAIMNWQKSEQNDDLSQVAEAAE